MYIKRKYLVDIKDVLSIELLTRTLFLRATYYHVYFFMYNDFL